MLFFDDNTQNINLKKLKALQEAHAKNLHSTGAVCSACQKPLSNEESMVAGMGPICLERTRFAEEVDRSMLSEIEGQKEPINKGLYPARTVILRERNEKYPRYVTVLSVAPLESVVIDRTEMNKNYEQSGSMAEAIAQSLYSFVPVEGESVAPTANPKHPEVMRHFKKFQKDLRNIYKERFEYIKSNPYSSYYNQVQSKKSLTEEQEASRNELLNQKDLNPDFFNLHWSKGAFHRATWIQRLNFTQLSEAKLLASALNLKPLPSDVSVKDYGLTDQEIVSGLQHSGQVFEKNLFKSFVDGNKNLIFLIETYKKFDSFEGMDKLFFIRLSSSISSGDSLKPEDVAKMDQLLLKYKISNKLFQK